MAPIMVDRSLLKEKRNVNIFRHQQTRASFRTILNVKQRQESTVSGLAEQIHDHPSSLEDALEKCRQLHEATCAVLAHYAKEPPTDYEAVDWPRLQCWDVQYTVGFHADCWTVTIGPADRSCRAFPSRVQQDLSRRGYVRVRVKSAWSATD